MPVIFSTLTHHSFGAHALGNTKYVTYLLTQCWKTKSTPAPKLRAHYTLHYDQNSELTTHCVLHYALHCDRNSEHYTLHYSKKNCFLGIRNPMAESRFQKNFTQS